MKTSKLSINVKAEHINDWLMLGVQGMQDEINRRYNISQPVFMGVRVLDEIELSNGNFLIILYSLDFKF